MALVPVESGKAGGEMKAIVRARQAAPSAVQGRA